MDEETLSKKIGDTHPETFPPPGVLICDAGQVVFEQGAPANQAFYVAEGLLEVVMEEEGHAVRLAEIGAGEVFGEMGVLLREARMARVRALKKSTVVIITREALEQRIENIRDPIVSALIGGFAKRLRTASIAQARYYKNLAVFQERVASLMRKADEGVDPARRAAFSEEIAPLLAQIEATLDKYRH